MSPQAAIRPDLIARLMRGLQEGCRDANREVVARLFPELGRFITRKMKCERVNHTLQPTALIGELCLELLRLGCLENRALADDPEKAAFFGLPGAS